MVVLVYGYADGGYRYVQLIGTGHQSFGAVSVGSQRDLPGNLMPQRPLAPSGVFHRACSVAWSDEVPEVDLSAEPREQKGGIESALLAKSPFADDAETCVAPLAESQAT
jgi:hypothetical protein